MEVRRTFGDLSRRSLSLSRPLRDDDRTAGATSSRVTRSLQRARPENPAIPFFTRIFLENICSRDTRLARKIHG